MDKRIEKILKKSKDYLIYSFWSSLPEEASKYSNFYYYKTYEFSKLFRLVREKKWFTKKELKIIIKLMQSPNNEDYNLGIEIIKAKNDDRSKKNNK